MNTTYIVNYTNVNNEIFDKIFLEFEDAMNTFNLLCIDDNISECLIFERNIKLLKIEIKE